MAFAAKAVHSGWPKLHTTFKGEGNQPRRERGRIRDRFGRLSRAWMWCNRGDPQSLGFRFAYDKWMTLAIYTHATDDMQDAATAALEEAFS